MNQDEKRKVENQLIVEGLSALGTPELVQQLANLVSNWPGDKHEYLRDLLNECDPQERYEAYHALKPHLSFKAKPLESYIAMIALRAGELVSQGRMRVEGNAPPPIEIGIAGHKIKVPRTPKMLYAIARVHCYLCAAEAKFDAPTPVAAMIEARKAGWVRDKGMNKETCPKCAEEQAAEVVALSHKENLYITDRRVKLDA
ncbi:MAG: hypothetical protein ACRD20_20515 [Terriglobales bacterium]